MKHFDRETFVKDFTEKAFPFGAKKLKFREIKALSGLSEGTAFSILYDCRNIKIATLLTACNWMGTEPTKYFIEHETRQAANT